jgi:hypothetical protein
LYVVFNFFPSLNESGFSGEQTVDVIC